MANDYMAKLAADLEGRTMGGLASRGRRGDTMLAYINPQEAEMLMEEGGSGTINPMTGLPEFFWSADTSADDEGNPGDAGDAGYDFEEAMAFAESANLIGNRQGNMDAVDAFAYQRAAIADPNLPTGEPWDPSTPGSKGGIPQRLKEATEKKEREQLELLRLVEQLKNKKPGEKVTTRSGRTLTKADIKAREAERKAQAAVRAKDSLPKDNEGKVSYNALFDRYATPKERDMKTEIKNGITIRTNRVDPPDTSELIDRHYKAHGLVEVKDEAGKLRLADDPGYGYSKDTIHDKYKDNRDEWEDLKFLSATLPGGARLRDRSGDLLAPFREESISTVGFPNQTLTGYSGPSLSPLAGGGKVDDIQALADSIESYGRKGDTMLAHINPKEAQMLKDAGGSGTINPMTGLPEFYDLGFGTDDSYEAEAVGAAEAAADQAMADAAAEQAAIDADVAADKQEDARQNLENYYGPPQGTPSYNEKGGFDYGVSGAIGPSGTYSSNRMAALEGTRGQIRERLGKDGFKNIEESILYTKILETGKISSEALDTLAGLLATPGVEQAMLSGYNDGYKYGGILGDALGARDDYLDVMSGNIQRAEKKVREGWKEQEDRDALGAIEEVEPESKDYFGDIIGNVVGGVKDFFGGPSEEALLAYAQAVQDAGPMGLYSENYTFNPLSDEAKWFDTGLGYVAPGPIGFAKGLYDVLAFATDSRIIGDVNTPYGTFQLTESGDLLAPDMSMDVRDPGGNEPAITRRRKVATEKPKEEEKKEEEKKDYFPEQKLPRLSQSGLETLQYAYRNDPPEVLDNILNKYTLPNQTSGLRALV